MSYVVVKRENDRDMIIRKCLGFCDIKDAPSL